MTPTRWRSSCSISASPDVEDAMKVICSWCKSEGHVGFLREKAPLGDVRETHGICVIHLQQVAEGRESLMPCDGDRTSGCYQVVFIGQVPSAAVPRPE